MLTLEKPNYIFVDFENTQELDVQRLVGQPVRVVIFCGQSQNPKIPLSRVRELIALGEGVEFIDSVFSGQNSLDFQMAYLAGRIIERDPNAFIHFVSKDQGFDAVVSKIKSDKRCASRVDSFAKLPFMKSILTGETARKETVESAGAQVSVIKARLSKIPAANRPRKRKTLASHIKSQTDIGLNDEGAERIIVQLINNKSISVGDAGSVTYHFE